MREAASAGVLALYRNGRQRAHSTGWHWGGGGPNRRHDSERHALSTVGMMVAGSVLALIVIVVPVWRARLVGV